MGRENGSVSPVAKKRELDSLQPEDNECVKKLKIDTESSDELDGNLVIDSDEKENVNGCCSEEKESDNVDTEKMGALKYQTTINGKEVDVNCNGTEVEHSGKLPFPLLKELLKPPQV